MTSRLLAWVRSNIATVLLIALMAVSLPVAWGISAAWNARIRHARQAEASDALNRLKARVTYQLPAIDPAREPEPPTLRNVVPNDAITEAFRALKEQREQQVRRVVQAAVQFNQRARQPLVPGLFPQPDPAQEQLLRLEMAKVVTGRVGEPLFQRLLRRINAGEPPDPALVAERLQDARTRELERLGPNPDEQARRELDRKMFARRFAEYQSLAQKLSVYAGPHVFTGTSIPADMPTAPPSLPLCFQWQFDYWTCEDIIEAIRLANSGPAGRLQPLDSAPVKRILEIALHPIPALAQAAGVAQPAPGRGPAGRSRMTRDEMGGPELAAPSGSPASPVLPDFSRSITGWRSGPDNQVYDVRRATVSLIVSARDLPRVIDAFSRANLMAVVGMNLSEVDTYDHLAQGYYYGQDGVVRADLVVEVAFLRWWTAPLMPPEVRQALAVAPPQPPTGDDGRG